MGFEKPAAAIIFAKKHPRCFLSCIIVAALALSPRANADDLLQLWDVRDGSIFVDSCPAIATNGTVYLTVSGSSRYRDVSGGKLEAITPHGVQKWIFKTPVDIKSSPAIGADGTIYFGCRDRKIYAVNPDGKLLWSFLTGAWVDSSPAIGTNGAIYAGSWDGKFYALNPDGTRKWEFPTGGPIDSSAAIGTNGVIYFGSHDNNFYALNPDGSQRWKFPTKGVIISSPAIGDDGTIIFTSVDGNLYAVNPDGQQKLRLWTGGVSGASPVIDAAGNIYLGTTNLFVACKADGTRKWDFGYPEIEGAATILADGMVYCACTGNGVGSLFGWTADGAVKYCATLGGPAPGSAAVAPDGTVYVGAETRVCIALKGNSVLARTSWPKFRGNAAQNGRASSN
jgi:outer membrane protein assembly factor BamB